MIVGRDYLPIIERLAGDGSSASMRTRIGRYYYAAFLESRAWCERRMGYNRSKMAREHQAVANLIGLQDLALRDALKELRAIRNSADYEDTLSDDVIVGLLLRAEELSRLVLDRLDALG